MRNGYQGLKKSLPWLALAAVVVLSACGLRSKPAELACGSSYLEAAVRDVLQQPIPMQRLVEPGTCPGHFDIRPSQAAALRQCRLLLRFDFQQALDSQVQGTPDQGPMIGVVSVQDGMCLPQTYLSVCYQVVPHLAKLQQSSPDLYQARLAVIQQRLEALEKSLRAQLQEAALTGVPVIASKRQRAFCEWLRLRVAADFTGADVARPSELEKAVKEGRAAGARFVVANLPEGRKAADFIADALGAKVVVFGNFPLPATDAPDFDAMLQDNVRQLVQAARSP